jgi:hypothetical protein
MTSEGVLIAELAEAKENIRRKYSALKHGEADARAIVAQTLKPIIDPLEKISSNGKTDYKEDEEEEEEDEEQNVENETEFSNNPISVDIESWFRSQAKDRTYGPRKLSNGTIKLGDKEIKFIGNTLVIGGITRLLTPGLVSLLFSKHPYRYTAQELVTYKSILVQTSAHLTIDGTKIKTGGDKYKNIITKLFASGGGGLSVRLQKHNSLVYWNDPNELVDRLRLLLATRSAGNTGVSNEILSIYEELHEAGIIRRIPDDV